MAAALAPEMEEPWLILASLATPRASVTYLERAIKINPKSARAREGMRWAVERLRRSQAGQSSQGQPQPHSKPVISGAGASTAGSSPETQPQVQETPPCVLAQSAPPSNPLPPRSLAKYRWSFLTLFVMAICATAAWVFWPGNVSPALAFLYAPQSTSVILGAPADVEKPTYTPSPTPTLTPTATFTQTPTFTLTPTSTDTPTPTETFTPTETPLPTDTPWPTDTSQPYPTDTPYTYPDNGGVRWIDVNLSQQMLYAYEGDTIVASFLVSTGVWQFPTVTGQFHIYVKYLYTLMAGDGYYLPDVPYTMYFYKGYGIHGTYWHNNFGHPMSHGCVNMYTPDAEWMFYWASVGTLVNIHY
jgi:lipoprotein-anchoring transpeptidase ErfK/SrfK